MRDAKGGSNHKPLRPFFNRRLKLEVHGSRVTFDADRLGRASAMRWIAGGEAVEHCTAVAQIHLAGPRRTDESPGAAGQRINTASADAAACQPGNGHCG